MLLQPRPCHLTNNRPRGQWSTGYGHYDSETLIAPDQPMKTFSQDKLALGEALLWHAQRNTLFWLDILNRRLFEKRLESYNNSADNSWSLPEHSSVLAADTFDNAILWMVTERSVGKFNLNTAEYEPILLHGTDPLFRANDGSVSPDGSFWFGTMEWVPTGINGSIYCVTSSGELREQGVRIGIPNTFAWSADGLLLYVSDSFRKKIFSFEVEDSRIKPGTRQLVVNLDTSESTPDGGAIDQECNLWNAHWDGHKLVKYDLGGRTLGVLTVPVPRPTSCCFGGPEMKHLFITSARDGLSEEELVQFPLSGSVFVVEQDVPGSTPTTFHLEL